MALQPLVVDMGHQDIMVMIFLPIVVVVVVELQVVVYPLGVTVALMLQEFPDKEMLVALAQEHGIQVVAVALEVLD